MRKSLSYGLGIFCLIASAAILLNTNILPVNIVNSIAQVQYDSGYKDYYHIGFPMPRNSLRQGTVYLPVYSVRDVKQMQEMMEAFDIGYAPIVYNDEFFEASMGGQTLRIYRYIDLLEYENDNRSRTGMMIDESEARDAAVEFFERYLPHKKPYDVAVWRESGNDEWIVSFVGQLGGLANRAFPTEIVMDDYGNIMRASHYFFEYEALGTADVITVRAALAQLPREEGRRVHLKGYEMVYGFENSVLVPVYRFYGKCAGGVEFEELVGALRFY